MTRALSVICFVYAGLCLLACIVTLDPHGPTLAAAALLVLAGRAIKGNTDNTAVSA